MIKFFSTLFVLFLLISNSITSQDNKDLIVWSEDRPLAWEDFKGRENKRSNFDALTSASFGFNYKYISGQYYTFIISVGFDKKNSWVKMKNATDDLLKHEQGHFDINEIYARLCIKELQHVKVKNMDKFGKEVEKVFDKISQQMIKFQDEYDKETDHSKVEDKQIEWNVKIENLLKETAQYKVKEMKVEFN
ncbi:DUF922 domain-containing protein [Bacteroidota bacterium]